jgi:hypothetical protein
MTAAFDLFGMGARLSRCLSPTLRRSKPHDYANGAGASVENTISGTERLITDYRSLPRSIHS